MLTSLSGLFGSLFAASLVTSLFFLVLVSPLASPPLGAFTRFMRFTLWMAVAIKCCAGVWNLVLISLSLLGANLGPLTLTSGS